MGRKGVLLSCMSMSDPALVYFLIFPMFCSSRDASPAQNDNQPSFWCVYEQLGPLVHLIEGNWGGGPGAPMPE